MPSEAAQFDVAFALLHAMPSPSRQRRLSAWTLAVAAIWLLAPAIASADDCLRPIDSVTTGVTLRAQPTAQSAKLGVLAPGQTLPLVTTVP